MREKEVVEGEVKKGGGVKDGVGEGEEEGGSVGVARRNVEGGVEGVKGVEEDEEGGLVLQNVAKVIVRGGQASDG